MYLKQISAQGFKSFADKINIDLTKGITGIVGPNGSGKSNIVDAVRWVLGEQSVKSLRGEDNMTDVIFSGSKTRNPLNIASVSLIFDNSDNYFSLSFDEISIKRRVYKDGTNEYYINGDKCRLKDIINLLLDSGIAKESFNIISQGKINTIINSKSNDRRVIFEEAAGVLKYKRRKEEAIRKLDKTHDNMTRVEDIIYELETQIEPLKKAKDSALKYEEATEQLKNIELALIVEDITNINFNYQNNKQKVTELNNQLIELNTKNNTNETETLKYRVALNNLDVKIKQNQTELIKLTTKAEKLNSQKNITIERQKYNVDDSKLHETILNLKEKEMSLKNMIHLSEVEIENTKKELDNLSNKNKEEEDIYKQIKYQKSQAETKLTEYLRETNSLKIKIESLKDAIDNNSLLPYSVKKVLHNPKLTGIHDVIGNVIEMDETYSLAISTILGSNVSNIIVDNESKAKEAIKYLKENNIGRATFFPLNIIKSRTIDSHTLDLLKNIKGFINIASNLVQTKEIYQNIVNNQLGNVIIADNISNANIISKNINYRYRVVTLDGTLLHVGGSLTGGNNKKNRNVITDKYELEKCIKELSIIENNISQTEDNINTIDNDLKNIENKIYIVHREKTADEQIIEGQKNLIINYQNQLNEIHSNINGTNNIINKTLTNEEQKLLDDYYKALSEKETLEKSIENFQKEKNNINSTLNDMEFLKKKENSELYNKQTELKNLEIEVNRMDVKLDNLLNTLSDTYNLTYEKAHQLYKLEIDKKDAQNEVNSLKRKIRDLGVINLGAKEEYDRISTRYEFLIKQKEDLIKAENTLLEIIKEMDVIMKKDFLTSFEAINKEFTKTFKELFKGGTAQLKLTDANNLLETGVEIIASPPGKKLTSISLLSGGEKTFTAISLLFAIIQAKTTPFCILDEVEAALDDVNVDSFGKYIEQLKNKTQFILITHKKKTMEYADVLYGITMQESGVSKLVSVKLEDIKV